MKKSILPTILLTAILLTSCAFPHYYYSPNSQNVPMFTEKNIFSGDIAGSGGTVNTCLEGQAGLSLPGHIALNASFMTGGTKHLRNNIEDISKVNYFEGAAGYYTSLGDAGVFEVYGGFGKGSQQHTFAVHQYNGPLDWTWIRDGTADLSFSKIFIQPDIGYKIDWFEGAISCRLSKINFSNIDVRNTVYHLDELNSIKQNPDNFLIEPAITLRAGTKAAKVQLQITGAKNLSGTDLQFEDVRFSIGLHFNIPTIKSQNSNFE